jgi:hypothetical protein
MLNFITKTGQNREIIPKVREKIAFGQLILACAFLVLAFSSCQVALSNRQLAKRQVTNVQLTDGTAILVEERSANYREPHLIQEFAKQWVSLMFSWEFKPETDPVVKTTQGDRLPANAWAASLMMEPQFGQAFINQLAKLIPPEIFSGRFQGTAFVRYVSPPRQMSQTTWQVDIIATRTLFDQTSRTQKGVIPFNKTLTIAAVAIPTSPLGDKANSLEQMVYQMRASGLEITEIVDYDPK